LLPRNPQPPVIRMVMKKDGGEKAEGGEDGRLKGET
jgi:hypothetical protein